MPGFAVPSAGAAACAAEAAMLFCAGLLAWLLLVPAVGSASGSPTPVLALGFDEGSGSLAGDSSGLGNHGELKGAEWVVDGKHGGAMSFEAAEEDWVTVADHPSLDLGAQFTLSAWVRPDERQAWQTVLTKESQSWFSYQLYAEGSEEPPRVNVSADGSSYSRVKAPAALPLGAWSHLTATSDGQTMRLYVDGVEVASGDGEAAVATDGPLRIGGNDVWGEHFGGLIDDVRVYDQALTAAEVQDDRDTAVQPAEPPEPPELPDPVLGLGFDEGSGSVAGDSSGLGNDGDLTGAEWVVDGKHGGALSFDDADEDWVTVADDQSLDLTDRFTLEAWVRPDEQQAWQAVLTKESESWFSYELYAEGNELAPEAYVSAGAPDDEDVDGQALLPLGQWSHLAWTSDGTTQRLYVDGVEVDSEPSVVALPTDGPLRIGGNDVWGEYFDGLIDDVRVYDQVLTAAQVQVDLDTAVPPAEPPEPPGPPEPVLALGFDEGAGSTTSDTSDSGADGILHGATWVPGGKFDAALSFDGVDDRVSVPAPLTGEGFTLEAWVKPRTSKAWSVVATLEGTEQARFRLYGQTDTAAPAGFVGADAEVAGSSALPVDVWSHLALMSDGTELRLYVNGTVEASAPASALSADTGAFEIGGNTAGEHFDGLIDEVRLYDGPIDLEQMAKDLHIAINPATEVSGETDELSPLVIDPSGDPFVDLVGTWWPARVASIRRMPDTRTITQVTIGDLGRTGDCPPDRVFTLKLWGVGGSPGFVESSAREALPTEPGRVTWQFAPVTLLKGHRYDFSVTSNNYNPCSTSAHRTWSRNSSRVDSGVACEEFPEVAGHKMWHVDGQDDGTTCAGGAPQNFEPSMPGGWLSISNYGTGPYVRTTNDHGARIPRCDVGRPVYWRTTDLYNEYVCVLTQFNPLGAETEDGWYDAGNWTDKRDYAPRDSYIKLHTIDSKALLDTYAPELRYDSDESFRADSPMTMTDNPGNQLVRFEEPVLISPDFGIDFLGEYYEDLTLAQRSYDHIDAQGGNGFDYFIDWASLRDTSPIYRDKTYGRLTYDSQGRPWLQYWFFYYFNSMSSVGYGDHEGDWEMVQYRLGPDLTPEYATYAEHEGGRSRPWGQVEKTNDGRPVVYVARDSHASYFEAGDNYRAPCPSDDFNGGNPDRVVPEVVELTRSPATVYDPRWLGWPGRWGAGDAPPGPAHQGLKWDDPGVWSDTVSEDTCLQP